MGCGASKKKDGPAEPEPVKEETGPSEEELAKKAAEEAAQKEAAEKQAALEAEKQKEAEEKKKAEEEERKKQEEAEAEARAKAEAEKNRGPLTCVISGPPGSIKGKLSEHIVKNRGVKHVSTGEAFRDAVKKQTAAGLRAKDAHKATGQVPDELHLEILKELLSNEAVAKQGWLLDGFPKTFEQAAGLEAAGIELERLVVVVISDDELVKRAVGRRIDPVTHQMYHLDGLAFGFPEPPDDDGVRNRLVQRGDDTEDRVRARLQQYRDTNLDLSSVFKKVLQVDGTKDVDELKKDIEAFLA